MELACVMAAYKFDATLVFMAVAGEEQGLLGAAHWARTARSKGLRIEAILTNDIISSPAAMPANMTPSKPALCRRTESFFADGFTGAKQSTHSRQF